jgi:hypothetical protein
MQQWPLPESENDLKLSITSYGSMAEPEYSMRVTSIDGHKLSPSNALLTEYTPGGTPIEQHSAWISATSRGLPPDHIDRMIHAARDSNYQCDTFSAAEPDKLECDHYSHVYVLRSDQDGWHITPVPAAHSSGPVFTRWQAGCDAHRGDWVYRRVQGCDERRR